MNINDIKQAFNKANKFLKPETKSVAEQVSRVEPEHTNSHLEQEIDDYFADLEQKITKKFEKRFKNF